MSTQKRRGRPISTVAGVLRHALKLIKNGWTQGILNTKGRRGRVCYCSMGAVRAAQPGAILGEKALNKLGEAIGSQSIVTWNDSPFRRKPEVVQAFKKAIRLAA